MFRSFDLDYLTVRTHAAGQSAYNPVERGIVSLSAKLADITLSNDKHDSHLDLQGKVINSELARKHFKHAGNTLCELWRWDNIFRKPVVTEYVSMENTSFSDNVSWKWIELHANICRYSLDIKKCNNNICCLSKLYEEAASLLATTNGFFLPILIGKDSHYVNSIHLLEYFDENKILGYDEHCSFINNYVKLSCSICKKYFLTAAIVNTHIQSRHSSPVKCK
ncbi:16988_t:CDS:2 [Cetraspora pellucida]|uniref:16988_t:CDS:1 n=1 Tax=Cetraspora pellucida TaxID=1433469 RepID=A0A9N9GP07_9GLOM|nr:16988_t:CDS:2 [Cetraspora pellucida]